MKPKLLLSISILTVCGVLLGITIKGRSSRTPLPAKAPQTFQVHGEVRDVDVANRTVRIAHEEIRDFMPAMTMSLPVKELSWLDGLASGDKVQFELSVTESDSWISHISKILPEASSGASDSTAARGAPSEQVSTELQKGEVVPNFELLDQNGKHVRLVDFRGRAVIITFIYTRCPLPNFCPLMSKNFQALQQRLEKEFPGRFQLVSITIDPKFDRPEILKEYAGRYAINGKSWSFATGSEDDIAAVANLFGLVREWDGGMISHNLRTALIGPDGRLRHVWKSNVWTPYEVDRMVGETLVESKTFLDARRS
jgi:protein SCO1/2